MLTRVKLPLRLRFFVLPAAALLAPALVLFWMPPSGRAADPSAALFPGDGPLPVLTAPPPLPSLSAQGCNACHREVHDQWAESGHASAAAGALYRASVAALGDPPLCRDCHLPLLQQRPEAPRGPGALPAGPAPENPAWSATLMTEGVTCAACHIREGTVLGPRDLPASAAPHPVRREPALQGVEACETCHQRALAGAESTPFLDTVGEWRRSAWGQAGIPCQDCHMPRISGAVAANRYAAYSSHRELGDREPSGVARALTLELSLRTASVRRGESLRATATLSNSGAGHSVPTGDPSHRVELRFSLLDPTGKPVEAIKPQSSWLYREVDPRPPFRTVSDQRLEAGAARSFDFAETIGLKLKPGRYTLRVSLHFWGASPETLKALGVAEADAVTPVSEQRIPVEIL
jgi:hypothetical protein